MFFFTEDERLGCGTRETGILTDLHPKGGGDLTNDLKVSRAPTPTAHTKDEMERVKDSTISYMTF